MSENYPEVSIILLIFPILILRSTIKLNKNFDNIVDAFAHLKKYSTVKNILKMTGLHDGIAIKKTFDDNFKSVVQKYEMLLECFAG